MLMKVVDISSTNKMLFICIIYTNFKNIFIIV